jgi:predicted RNase H-like nuclease (RuvC/YqgF family)
MFSGKISESPEIWGTRRGRREPKEEYTSAECNSTYHDNEENEGARARFEIRSQNGWYRPYRTNVYKEDSVCPSIENVLMDEYLEDLKEEIILKSEGLRKAERYIAVLQEELDRAKNGNRELAGRLAEVERRGEELEEELSTLRSVRVEESTKRSSVQCSKVYTTERHISAEVPAPPAHPLALISYQIFNEFAKNYESLVNELGEWETKERD